MKFVIILGLLVIVLALVYLRLRPYIMLTRRMMGVLREVRGMNQSVASQPLQKDKVEESLLVRCDACSTWIPAARALKLRSSRAVYCSHTCLENSASERSRRKTAG